MNSYLATLAVFLVAAISLCQAQGVFVATSCCYDYVTTPIPQRNLKAYEYGSGTCSRPAIIFVTVADHRICADPCAQWVQDRIRHLPQS